MGLILALFFSVTISANALTELSIFSAVLCFYPYSEYTNEKHLDLLMFG